MLTSEDMKTLEAKGVTQDELESQINRFKTGFPFKFHRIHPHRTF